MRKNPRSDRLPAHQPLTGEGEDVWIPTSQVHDDSEVYKPGTAGVLVIPRWVAEMKELPYRETRMVR